MTHPTEDGHAAAVLASALDYAAAGLHVFPARVTIVDNRKQSQYIPDWDTVSTTDPDTIRAWFGPGGRWRGRTLCVDTGKSELVVIDCDGPDGIKEWDALTTEHRVGATWRLTTPGAGQHHYFRADPNHPVRNSAKALAPHIDVRGVGGLAFAAPSRDDRGTYRWVEGTPEWAELPLVPQLVLDLEQQRGHNAPIPTVAIPTTPPDPQFAASDAFFSARTFTDGQAQKFCEPHLAALRGARDGTINHTLNATALVLGHFVPHFLTYQQAEQMLLEALKSTVYDGRTWRAENTIRSGITAAARDWIAERPPPGQPSNPHIPAAPHVGDSAAGIPLPNLPAEFWTSRPVLTHIRRAAHARVVSADVVLHATLSRLAAMTSHQLHFDSGRGESSLNYFAAAVGPSGAGKSTAAKAARGLIAQPSYLAPSPDGMGIAFHDGLPLGSGEGIAEAFMGTKEIETGDVRANGQPITKKMRGMVRNNVFAVADEGEMLLKIGERNGATIGAVIRSAWGGETIGQANASEDRTRIVPAGTYSLGMLVGFQPGTALPLLLDTGPGTAQRFVWASAVDPTIPDDPIPHPGVLGVNLNAQGWRDSAVTGCMTFPAGVVAELRREHLAKARGELIVDERDSQAPLMRCKIAALLALLDGRLEVDDVDWKLAGQVWLTSCGVRDALVEHGQGELAREAEEAQQRRIQLAERTAAVVGQVDGKLVRLAQALAEKVTEAGGMTRGAARRTLRSDSRSLFDAVVDTAASQGWIVETESGLLPAPLRVA